jgi:hypothetical protein
LDNFIIGKIEERGEESWTKKKQLLLGKKIRAAASKHR